MNNHKLLTPVASDENNVDAVPLTKDQLESVLTIQQLILHAVVEEKSESDILAQLCKLAESLLDNCSASVLMLDQKSQLISILSAPSMPEEGRIRFSNIRLDSGNGSCTAAILSGQPSYIYNTFSDQRASQVINLYRDFNICSCWSVPVYDRNNKVIGGFSLGSFEHRTPNTYHDRVMKMCSSIISILQERKALWRLSMTDKLTGLWNRVKLDNVLAAKLLEYNRHAETYCVLLLDIDHFKSVNDTYGHNAGDTVLVELSKLLTANIRGNDIIGRWGGEEFMMVLSKTDADTAKRVADKIRILIKQHIFPDIGKITISIGICEVNQELSVLNVIDRADRALYVAKKIGRDQVCVFEHAPEKSTNWKKLIPIKKFFQHQREISS